ncbi:TonB-dependent receptor, partial [Xanthomonas sp. Kuri4-1]
RDGVRAQLLYAPDDGVRLRLIADYQRARARPAYVLAGSYPVDGVDLFRARLDRVGAHARAGQVDQDDESRTLTTQGGVSADAEWTLHGGHRLRAVTALRYFGFAPHLADPLDIALYADSGADVRDRTWSQSLRLDSPAGAAFDYALGLDYFGENLDTFAHDHYAAGPQVTAWYGNTSNTGRFVQRWGRLDQDVLSAYAQGTWHLSPRMDLTAGTRVSYEHKTGSFRRLNKNDFDSGPLAQDRWLPAALLNLRYRVSDTLQVYASAAYGEKSGGLNVSSGAVARAGLDSLYLDPEHTRSAEFGLQGSWLDHRVELDAALFWTRISGFQTTAYDLESQSSYLINAGALRSRGIETTLSLRPWQGLTLGLNGTLLDARYLDFADARCPPEIALAAQAPAACDLTGERVFRSPRLTYTATARYEWPLHGADAFVAGRYAHRGWAYGTVDDSRFTRMPAYGLLALSAGLRRDLGSHSWSATLWLDNVTDRRYYRTLAAGDYGSAYGVPGEPRTFGASLEYRY